MPKAPAIILLAVAVVFSGRLSPFSRVGAEVEAEYRGVGFPLSSKGPDSHFCDIGSAWGDIGVGGGGAGPSFEVICFNEGPGASTGEEASLMTSSSHDSGVSSDGFTARSLDFLGARAFFVSKARRVTLDSIDIARCQMD